MIKKALCLILLFTILIPNGAVCVSGDTKHDADLKEIFWGKNSTHYDTEELIVLQWATYFAVDCIASSTSKMNDEAGLAILRNYGIEGVPNDVSDFQYKDNKFTNRLSGNFKTYMSLSVSMTDGRELEDIIPNAKYELIKRSGFVYSENYADSPLKKRDMYCFKGGACFDKRFSGKIFDVSDNGRHPVYRYAKPLLIGIR